eukprot:TRINITY_DN9883_c0_g1_i1.p1 TRINITY_DN9883_c0_g1~~TRINITY_DN9883_c0_g1_i1.p1  ORF type:complete len:738 (-),score=197.44 TRINITY_DN9883_c0_g1_i1:58-2271(-)
MAGGSQSSALLASLSSRPQQSLQHAPAAVRASSSPLLPAAVTMAAAAAAAAAATASLLDTSSASSAAPSAAAAALVGGRLRAEVAALRGGGALRRSHREAAGCFCCAQAGGDRHVVAEESQMMTGSLTGGVDWLCRPQRPARRRSATGSLPRGSGADVAVADTTRLASSATPSSSSSSPAAGRSGSSSSAAADDQPYRSSRSSAATSAGAAAAVGLALASPGIVRMLRRAAAKERTLRLSDCTRAELQEISRSLNLPVRKDKKAVLRERILQTLAEDDRELQEDRPLGRLVRRYGELTRKQQEDFFLAKKVPELKAVAEQLRLSGSGSREALAMRIVAGLGELHEALRRGSGEEEEEQASGASRQQQQAAAVLERRQELLQQNAEVSPRSGATQATGAVLPTGLEIGDVIYYMGGSRSAPNGEESVERGQRGEVIGAAANGLVAVRLPRYSGPVPASLLATSRPAEAPRQLEEEGEAEQSTSAPFTSSRSRTEEAPSEPPPATDVPRTDAASGQATDSSRESSALPPTAGASAIQPTTVMESDEDKKARKEQGKLERRQSLLKFMQEELGEQGVGQNKDLLRLLPSAEITTDSPRDEAGVWTERRQQVGSESPFAPPPARGSDRERAHYKGWHSEPPCEGMHLVGELGRARQAWCQWWDAAHGCGELLDLGDRSSVTVVAAALQTGCNVSPRLRSLRRGEFVEYRRVPAEDEQDLPARAVLVRGIEGRPLMCETPER